MSNSALRALVLTSNISAFGVTATVTRPAPDDTPIETTVLWATPATEDRPIGSSDFVRREQRRTVALLTADVPTCPKGTVIDAADERNGTVRRWRVQGIDVIEAEHVRAIVVLEPER